MKQRKVIRFEITDGRIVSISFRGLPPTFEEINEIHRYLMDLKMAFRISLVGEP